MKTTQQLHDLGQSLWLDNITRELLIDGTLARYISEFSVTGLTSNPTIFEHAIKNGSAYDDAIRQKTVEGKSGEALFFELALEDLTRAADLFRPVYDATGGVDGWVSLEVSPLLANDTAGTVKQAAQLHARAQRPNLFIKIPGTREGVPAIEEVDLRRRADQRDAAVLARAVPRGGRSVPARNRAAHRGRPRSEGRFGRIAFRQPMGRGGQGQSPADASQSSRHRHRQAHLQGLPRAAGLAALAETRRRRCPAATPALGQHRHQGSAAPDTLYIEALAAPDTINTMPEKTLQRLRRSRSGERRDAG